MKITLLGLVPPYKGGNSEFNAALLQELGKNHTLQILSWKKQYPSFIVKNNFDSRLEPFANSEFFLHYANPLSWRKAGEKIKNFNPDLIIFPWVSPLSTPVFLPLLKIIKKSSKAKVVVLCHNVLPHEKTPLDLLLSKLFFNSVDLALVHSQTDKENLITLAPHVRIIQSFHPLYDTYPEARSLPLPQLKKNRLLFFGYVRPYKGLRYLLEAMPLILKEKEVHLVIAGEFWENKEEYLKQVDQLHLKEHITFVDHYIPKEEVGGYFKQADLVILPYVSGTQSGIIQLAYHYNTPVLCTNVGGFNEIVLHDKTGFVVPPKNPKALADAILTFYKEKKKDKFSKNIQEEKSKYSWKNYCDLLLSSV